MAISDMNIDLTQIPAALKYFFIGALVNVFIYFVFSPNEADLFGIMDGMGLFTMEVSTKYVIWGGMMILCTLFQLVYPVWLLFGEGKEGEPQ